MSWRGTAAALVVLIGALVVAPLAWRMAYSSVAPPSSVDPAFGYYTARHTASYGGIDRWAYYGMRVERVAQLLDQQGYACRLPQASPADGRLHGVHPMVCDKSLHWPLARTLTITADIDYGTRGRLVAAGARSMPLDGARWRSTVGAALRHVALMEPASLAIRGFEVDTPDLLARLAVDAMRPRGWHLFCDSGDPSPECAQQARTRRANGLPGLPQGAANVVGPAALDPALERVRLVPLATRDPEVGDDDSLRVRVTDGRMWLDFASRDLAGHDLRVSIALDSAGGAASQLVATVDAHSRTVPLAGDPQRSNNGPLRYLVPLRGAGNPRASMWLDLPDPNYERTLERLGEGLSRADPAFALPLVKVVLDSFNKTASPEEKAGLYPLLRIIEQRAAVLHAADAARWLPAEAAGALIRQAYPDDVTTRAAWALATCAAAGAPALPDPACWQRLARADPAVPALLRRQVAQLLTLYGALEPSHPVRVHLERLGRALDTADATTITPSPVADTLR